MTAYVRTGLGLARASREVPDAPRYVPPCKECGGGKHRGKQVRCAACAHDIRCAAAAKRKRESAANNPRCACGAEIRTKQAKCSLCRRRPVQLKSVQCAGCQVAMDLHAHSRRTLCDPCLRSRRSAAGGEQAREAAMNAASVDAYLSAMQETEHLPAWLQAERRAELEAARQRRVL